MHILSGSLNAFMWQIHAAFCVDEPKAVTI